MSCLQVNYCKTFQVTYVCIFDNGREKNPQKMTLKRSFFKISKKMRFFLMSQGSFSPKIKFLGQKVCSVARGQTDRQTDTKVKTEDTLSGFQEFFLQSIIKFFPSTLVPKT